MDVPILKVTLVRDGPPGARPLVDCPEAAYRLVQDLGAGDREHFVVLLLDVRGGLIGRHLVSVGSLTASIVHPREVFKAALLANANSLILAHNHPSGDPTPSPDDLAVTRRLVEAGHLLGVEVYDHLIVVPGGYRSLADQGELPRPSGRWGGL